MKPKHFPRHKLVRWLKALERLGSERIAVLAALNIANEMLAYKNENQDYTSNVDGVVRRIQDKIDDALMKGGQLGI